MKKGTFIRSLVLVMTCAVLCSGCSKWGNKGGKNGPNTRIGDPIGVGNEIPMDGDKIYGGTKVSEQEFSPSSVSFAYDSYKIASSELSKIERTADFMKRKKDVRLVVEGHCDERGSRDYNMSLGEHRGLAVRAYLVRLGVEAVRIQTRSYGEEKPIDAGHDERAWRANRRGEFALYR